MGKDIVRIFGTKRKEKKHMCTYMCRNSVRVVRAVRGRRICTGKPCGAELPNKLYDINNLSKYVTNLGLTKIN